MDQIEDQLSSEDPELEARLSRAPRYAAALTKTVWLVTAAVIVLGVLLALADRML